MLPPGSPARRLVISLALALLAWLAPAPSRAAEDASLQRRLYVAAPGIRDYLEFGGHGVLVFDLDHDYRFVRRIPGAGLDDAGKPMNVKGIVASAATGRFYVTTLRKLACYDLANDRLLWERAYPDGCDRPSITPDGSRLFLPSLEKSHWLLVDASNGDVVKKLDGYKAAHNTIVGLDGSAAYLADRASPLLAVIDVKSATPKPSIGPFAKPIRPFTINGAQSRAYVCVDDLLGFEIGDLRTGRKLHRVEVQGFKMGTPKRHGCPSHGVGLTPDEKELWVCDAVNQRMHVFDNTVDPPRQVASLPVREQPGWITFSLDGRHAWPSTGEVYDVATRRIVTTLADDHGAPVHSEKMIEIQFQNGKAIRTGDQFGLGRAR